MDMNSPMESRQKSLDDSNEQHQALFLIRYLQQFYESLHHFQGLQLKIKRKIEERKQSVKCTTQNLKLIMKIVVLYP